MAKCTAIQEETRPPRLSLEVLPLAEETGAAEAALYLDRPGLERLRSTLNRMASGELDQAHFFSWRWGGEELTGERWRADGLVTHHLKILLRQEGEPLRETRYSGER